MRAGEASRAGQAGFTYIALLVVLAVTSVGLAAVGPLWAQSSHRDREEDVLRLGALYAAAIVHYHRSPCGSVRELPRSLEDLVLDTRGGCKERHLRRLYPSPWRDGSGWRPIFGAEGRVIGVYLASEKDVLRRTPIELRWLRLSAAQRYSDWQFIPTLEGRGN